MGMSQAGWWLNVAAEVKAGGLAQPGTRAGAGTGRLQEGKGREGKAGAWGRGNQPHIPSPQPWVGCQVLGSFDHHPLALAPTPMGTCWMTTGKWPASGALAHLPLTSAGPAETGVGEEEAGTGGGTGCTLTSGFLASCSLTSISR